MIHSPRPMDDSEGEHPPPSELPQESHDDARDDADDKSHDPYQPL